MAYGLEMRGTTEQSCWRTFYRSGLRRAKLFVGQFANNATLLVQHLLDDQRSTGTLISWNKDRAYRISCLCFPSLPLHYSLKDN